MARNRLAYGSGERMSSCPSVARRIVSLEAAGNGEPPQPGCDLALIATPIGQVEAALALAAAHGARAAAVLDRCDDDVLARRLVEKARAALA